MPLSRQWLLWLLWLLALLLLMPVSAQAATRVVLLLSGQSALYQQFVEGFGREIQGSGLDWSVMSLGDLGRLSEPSASDDLVIVSVGLDATRAALAWHAPRPRVRVLATLLPRRTWLAISAPVTSERHAALHFDQPPQRQLALVRALLPQTDTLGMVLGPDSSADVALWQDAARAAGLELRLSLAQRESDLYAALGDAMQDSGALLAVPDATVMNAATAQNVLLTSFRVRVPVIGFSAAYVSAGSLAAVFSTPLQAGQEAAQMLRESSLVMPARNRYPRRFSIRLNPGVAASLGLRLPTEEQVLRVLQAGGR